ncbi:hypothetical protein TIN4_109 [Tsukamurella phage TIN4]|uniref:Uncharacterized protein n=2 Tax=Tinduovirus TIN3 TaxID=1982571 RepID=A0A0K0N5M9_9CAUD|nr:DNA primase [Tsukamurella phage TIN3]YP_009604239.1 DNA primase [Tsukamurella phage TIN4]AKJ71906.1 hypothetical protein TIN3_109 [Tsukamurella phage TIN3]AKJ72015.1 hypothetical protein TIN4_109 [Tsukamurella phage TIN4]
MVNMLSYINRREHTRTRPDERGDTLSEPDLAALIAKRFVQRKDVKAIQTADGGYRPIREPWKMKDLRAHVAGEQTFGHYTCDASGLTKLIVFDCDLDTGYCELYKRGQPLPECCEIGHGSWVQLPSEEQLKEITDDAGYMDAIEVHNSHPRADWLNRKHPGRAWYKYQMRTIVDALTSSIVTHLGLGAAAAYSGNKGVHAYAFFPEPVNAKVARQAALYTLEYAGKLISSNHNFEAVRGKNFFKHTEPDPQFGVQNFTVEIFPKQDSMEGKDLGNLVRLPGGKNNKNPKDPCFFIDQTVAQAELKPHPNPAALLESGNPYASF